MLLTKNELKIIKQLVQSTSKCEYTKFADHYKITIVPSENVEISIIDDSVSEIIPCIIIDFENDAKIESLTININSGKFHDKGEIIGDQIDNDDFHKNNVNFRTNNKINKLIVQQKICTENIYSYYGNQDGFNPCTISIVYDRKKYKNIRLAGQLDVENGEYECHYDKKIYSLSVEI